VPTPKVATYAYVNPVVAVYFGWLLLDEKIDVFMLLGTLVIVAAVVLVTRSKLTKMKQSPTSAKEPELSAVNATGD
jgi:drug/metabolite transporter (DMT)-like permease